MPVPQREGKGMDVYVFPKLKPIVFKEEQHSFYGMGCHSIREIKYKVSHVPSLYC